MNNPEYILVDEFGTIVSKTKTALNIPVLNYQYGYVTELAETLAQYSKSPNYSSKKYPLVWLVQPFTVVRGEIGWYGRVDNLRIFIIQESSKQYKATERMTNTFKPVIYPVYRELMLQIKSSGLFYNIGTISHEKTDRYYWGEEQTKLISDVFDCMEVSKIKLKINDKC